MAEPLPPEGVSPTELSDNQPPPERLLSPNVLEIALGKAATAPSIDAFMVSLTEATDAPTRNKVTEALAQAGIVTTELTRDAGTQHSFKREWLAHIELSKIADNIMAFTKGLTGYEELNEVEHARKLLTLFRAVRDARFADIHLEDAVVEKHLVVRRDKTTNQIVITRENKTDGTVVFGHTELVMGTASQAVEARSVFQQLLQAEDPADYSHARRVNPPPVHDGGVDANNVVAIENMNEFDWHVLELGFEELRARVLWADAQTILPTKKGTLAHWLLDDGETFNLTALADLQGVADDYCRMRENLAEKVAYREGNYEDPKLHMHVDSSPFGTAPAAIFEIARKARSGISRQLTLRGGNNPVQHRNKARRLRLEGYANVQLRRTRIQHSNLRDKPRAPGGIHAPSLTEQGADEVRAMRASARDTALSTAEATLKVTEAALSILSPIGIAATGISLAKRIPRAVRAAKSTTARRSAWRQQHETAKRDIRTRVAGELEMLLAKQSSQAA